jgi:hypothetical protein
MRFIAEIHVYKEAPLVNTYEYVSVYRRQYEEKMGNTIGEAFQWENPVNGNHFHHKLEIEAFPMDKWIEFKKRFADALPDYDTVSRTRLINAIADLESFPKPEPTNNKNQLNDQKRT